MLIDSEPFNQRPQNPHWYNGFKVQPVNGFPTNADCNAFLNGLTHLIICESPYSYYLMAAANQRRIKVALRPELGVPRPSR